MKELRVKLVDVAAAALWLVALAFLTVESIDGEQGLWAAWAMVALAGAVVFTLIAWASRRMTEARAVEQARLDRIHQGLTVIKGADAAD